MTTIAELVDGHETYALWHGTRADIRDGLVVGADAVGAARDVIARVWDVICTATDRQREDLQAYDVEVYFRHPVSLDRAVDIGNSIRFLRGDFHYSVIAFAFDAFSARGYAQQGSELGNAILALTEAALREYPQAFQDGALLEDIHTAQTAAKHLLAAEGTVLKLVRMPVDGFFCAPGHLDEAMTAETDLAHHIFPERLNYTELFFRGTIPLDHFEVHHI
jgi:hypothetical protein